MKSGQIPIDRVVILPCVERPASKVADDRDAKSIAASGIQQPLIGVEHQGEIYLAKGLRRIRIGKHLKLKTAPFVYDKLPKGREVEEYVRELRMILQMHRQDLCPSQKAELVETLKTQFDMSHKDVALYLGVDADTITNWLAIRRYVPEIVREVDAGILTVQKARVFDGLTEDAQKKILTKHRDELVNLPWKTVHKAIRTKYSPKSHPEFYRNASKASKRLGKDKATRKPKPRTTVTPNEQRRLLTSVEMKDLELNEGKLELKEKDTKIRAAAILIAAVLRDEDLSAATPPEVLEGFQVFNERFGA